WGFSEYGKLWTYQLQAFEFLKQDQLEKEKGLKLIADFSKYLYRHPSAFDPYTASLRVINWIKFFSFHQVTDTALYGSLLSQTKKLFHSTEWHLQNNHLLENAFALLFAGIFFGNEKFYQQGKRILEKEIDKQILPDGAHFELCPMYHMLMLNRVLESKEMLSLYKPDEKALESKLSSVASKMLGWMKEMQFENGDMPVVNDSANGIAPSCDAICSYANRLGISSQKIELKESGFRKHKTATYECLIYLGGLEPLANAGHGHADSLSFILYGRNKPFIIDTGISTYENNFTRQYERSTLAHNTVTAGTMSQSNLWGSFRVGKRVKMLGVNQGAIYIESSIRFFDGSIKHKRRFEFFENSLIVRDSISGEILEDTKSFLYVNKNAEIAQAKSKLNSDIASIEFTGDRKISIDEAFASTEFNKPESCNRITISFTTDLITTFTFHNSNNSGK
ncbi:MAG: alginate lyase family protein, partial [Bacteroidetes bacterium]|nr:alginate lyase family protein [Bacteroidota bacterium]